MIDKFLKYELNDVNFEFWTKISIFPVKNVIDVIQTFIILTFIKELFLICINTCIVIT